MEPDDHYLVISSDGHAGATVDTYLGYLPSRYHEEFDAWRSSYVSPWLDLGNTETRQYRRNFDSAIRQEDLEGDGIVGEVLYPNTVPPFENKTSMEGTADVADARELELRWAGIHAHNQWLADFCDELPGRRAGVAQVLFEDVDRALEEVRWAADRGLFGGILIPNPSPQSKVDQLHSPAYEPIWTECEALGLPVHTHGGGGVPSYGDFPTSPIMMFLEFGWYGLRPLTRLMMSGVFERHPELRFVMTEIGSDQLPSALEQLDYMAHQIRTAGSVSVESRFAGSASKQSTLLPSEYWERQCFLGASLMTPKTSAKRHRNGIHTMMWGADYPHGEGTHPYTWPQYRHVFAGIPYDEAALLLGLNAARAFGFDVEALRPIADRIGPRPADVDRPLTADEFPPAGAATMSFARPLQKASSA